MTGQFLWFLGKRPALFKSGPWHFHQDNAQIHYSIFVTDYLTIPHSLYSPDLAPCDFWLFSKLRGCRYETIEDERGCDEGHWHAHTRGLPWGLEEVVGTVQVHCSRRRLLRKGQEFHMCTINKSGHTKKSLKIYLMILVYICFNLIPKFWL